MSNLTTALLVVLSVNLMLFIGQAAVIGIDPSGPNFYNCEDSILGAVEQSGCSGDSYVLDDSDPASRLPSSVNSVDPENGYVYTDDFSTGKSWLLDGLGLKYVGAILGAPMYFLSAIGLPPAFAFGVGALWYGVTLFLIVAFLLGRDA